MVVRALLWWTVTVEGKVGPAGNVVLHDDGTFHWVQVRVQDLQYLPVQATSRGS